LTIGRIRCLSKKRSWRPGATEVTTATYRRESGAPEIQGLILSRKPVESGGMARFAIVDAPVDCCAAGGAPGVAASRSRRPRRASAAGRQLSATPQPLGLGWDELVALARPLAGAPNLLGVSVADFNPDMDPDGAHGARVVDALESVLSHAIR
jgi:hypothetical protein